MRLDPNEDGAEVVKNQQVAMDFVQRGFDV